MSEANRKRVWECGGKVRNNEGVSRETLPVQHLTFLKQKHTQQMQWKPLVFPKHALSFLCLRLLSLLSAVHLTFTKPSISEGPECSSNDIAETSRKARKSGQVLFLGWSMASLRKLWIISRWLSRLFLSAR